LWKATSTAFESIHNKNRVLFFSDPVRLVLVAVAVLCASDADRGSIRFMPRTTLDIDASVLAELKRRQRREQKSLGQLASELLALALADAGSAEPAPLRWKSRSMRTRIDLEDKEALAAALDER
jgi:Arc/MetJ family transcription regulator